MEDEAARQPPASPARRRIRVAAGAAALVLVTLAVAWTQRLWVAERVAAIILSDAGIASAELTVTRLGLSGATVSAIRIGGEDGQRIKRIDATYTPGGLWNGRVDRITVTGARLRATVGADGFTLDGISLPTGTDTATAGAPPFQSVALNDIGATIDTPHGPVSLSASGEITSPDGETMEIGGRFEIESDYGAGAGRVSATMLASGERYGRVTVHEGTARGETFRATGLNGAIQAIALPDGGLDLDANLTSAEVTAAGETFPGLHASASLRRTAAADSPLAIDLLLKSPHGRAEATGIVSPSDSGTFRVATEIAVDIARDDSRAVLHGTIRGERAPGGALSADIRIKRGDLAHDGMAVAGIEGDAQVSQRNADTITGTAGVKFQSFEAYGLTGRPGSLSVKLDDNTVAMRADLAWTDGTLNVVAEGRRDGTGGLGFELAGRFGAVAPFAKLHDGIDASGTAALAVKGRVFDPIYNLQLATPDPAALLSRIEAQGWIEGDLTGIAISELLRGGTYLGRIEATVGADSARLSSRGLRLSAERLAPAVLTALPAPLRTRLARPTRLAIEPRDGEVATLLISRRDDGYVATANSAIRIASGRDNLTLAGSFEGQLDANLGFVSLSAPHASVDLAVRDIAGGGATANLSLSDLRASPKRIRAAYKLDGTFTRDDGGPLSALKANTALTGMVAGEEGALSLTAVAGSRLSLDGFEFRDKARSTGPLTVTLTKNLRAGFDPAKGLPSLTYSTTLAIPETRIAVKAGNEWTDIALAAMPVVVGGEGATHRVDIRGGAIALPQHKLRASGIDLSASLGDSTAATLTVNDIRHQANLFTPLRLTAEANQTGNTVRFDARLFDPPERISVGLRGTHDLAAGRGGATIESRKLTFLPTVLQPAQLFPVLGRTLTEVDGSVEARAKLAWAENGLDSSLDLLVEAQALKADEFTVENVSAVIRFDSLYPLTTPPGQEVAIGLLDVGVPLTNGRGVFRLESDGRIHATLQELDFFGGRIDSEPFTMPKSFDGFTVPLRVNGVSLERLLALTKAGDLTATGTLNGSLPIVVRDAKVAIRDGVLESAPGGGTIRYTPAGVGPALSEANEGTKLFLDIVKDFRYESIRVALDEDESGEVAFRFRVEGHNKAVYDGVPVVLNVSMDGPLRKILGQGVKAYTLPANLLERINSFRRGNQPDTAPASGQKAGKPESGDTGS